MIDRLLQLDSDLLLLLNGCHSLWADRFMMLFSSKMVWVPMYATLLVILGRLYTARHIWLPLLGIALAIIMSDQLCATVIRPVVERLRPSNLLNPLSEFVTVVNGYRGGSYGFPSCHAANSFALAVVGCILVRSRCFAVFVLLWALFNSLSRAYLGVHYPGDLIVGGILGAICGAAAGWLVRIGMNRWYRIAIPTRSEVQAARIRVPYRLSYRLASRRFCFRYISLNVACLFPLVGMLTILIMLSISIL